MKRLPYQEAGLLAPRDAHRQTTAASGQSSGSIGLSTETLEMADGLVLRPEVQSPPDAVDEFAHAGYRWRCLPEYRALASDGGVAWLSLSNEPAARRVKRNGHREVWRLETAGETFFVKRYRCESLLTRVKTWLRGPTACLEWTVGHYAAAHGIAAVRPVLCGWPTRGTAAGPSLLVTRGVPGAVSLSDYWLTVREHPARARALAQQTARLIARAHQCGFHHLDMHAGNILVQTQAGATPTVLFVDLHNVRVGRCVRPADVIRNLAQLNQWFRRHASRTQRLRFLRAYLAARDEFAQAGGLARNWTIDPRELLVVLDRTARRHAERLWAKRDRRSMRSGTYYARIGPAPGWRGHVLLATKHPRPGSPIAETRFDRGQWREWLADPTQWADPDSNDVLKDSHSALVCRGTLPAQPQPLPVICKRPRPRSWLKRVWYALGGSRNLRAWRRANMLLNRDLPAAQPLAVVEQRLAGLLRTDSILITERIEPAVDLEAFLLRFVARQEPRAQRRMKDVLVGETARLLADLADRGFVHRDCKAANLLVRWEPPYAGRPQLVLIDMDGIRPARRRNATASDAAAVRLNASLAACPAVTRTDRLRFLRTYLLKTGRRTDSAAVHWRRFAAQSTTKLDAQRLRRAWKLAHYGRE